MGASGCRGLLSVQGAARGGFNKRRKFMSAKVIVGRPVRRVRQEDKIYAAHLLLLFISSALVP